MKGSGISVEARPSSLPEVSFQLWAECSGCGWKQWIDLAILRVNSEFEPHRPPVLSIEAMFDGSIPRDLFAPHRCAT